MIQGVKYTRAGDARCIFISRTILPLIGCLGQHLASYWLQTLQSVCCPRAIFRQEYSPDLRVLILTDPDSGVRVLRVSVTGTGPGKGGARGHSLLTSDTSVGRRRDWGLWGQGNQEHHVRNISGSNNGIHRKCFD